MNYFFSIIKNTKKILIKHNNLKHLKITLKKYENLPLNLFSHKFKLSMYPLKDKINQRLRNKSFNSCLAFKTNAIKATIGIYIFIIT